MKNPLRLGTLLGILGLAAAACSSAAACTGITLLGMCATADEAVEAATNNRSRI